MPVTLSIVTPAFNETANLDALYERLVRSMEKLAMDWEWLIVDDHSPDDTFGVIQRLSVSDGRVRGIRLARNSGSHVAITCGLHHARGDAAVVMAADLQDPPETLQALIEAWRNDAQIVWAVRRARQSGFAALYYRIMRRVVGLHEMPANGADFFLVDRIVLDAFRRFPEGNVSVLALITWVGFRQVQIPYNKAPRAGGQSGWTLARKLRLVQDSVAAFSDLPLRMCWYAGVAFFVAACLLAGGAVLLLPSAGAGLLLVLAVMVGLTGVQLLAIGVVGQYVWRALEEARRRPQYLIERLTGVQRAALAPDT